ncbi:ImmA/IrrE family metallo-endopeptidase [Enterococcus gallinarum]|uniref:ImmA/IrrE family metallo-endopeptidase n=1 Tax=Enterococcus gallinarum TaxID=1353 RepID=UPI001F576AD2|nr:ImmA/IrrE family metallo-endopeptidase [Enterococcus gallinarum]MCR1945926.1 ImmA/IrrE family metallo-endopeptidase [Enterococcus gallinarum]
MVYKKKQYKKRSTKEIQEEVNNLVTKGLEAIKQYSVDPKDQLELLQFMSRFHNYSIRNQSLILAQFPGAYAVGGYVTFKNMGFPPIEKSKIRILRPNFFKLFKDTRGENRMVSSATPEEKTLIAAGKLESWEVKHFKPESVFDISQTTARPEDYPKLFPNRRVEFSVESDHVINQLESALFAMGEKFGVPINNENTSIFGTRELGSAKGHFARDNIGNKEIVLNSRTTKSERIAVLIHELAHATLHDPTNLDGSYWTTQNLKPKDLSLKELQAEMVSYVVSYEYGIDTSEQAIPYIASWTRHLAALEESGPDAQFHLLEDVQKVSHSFIQFLDTHLEQQRSAEKEKVITEEQVQAFCQKFHIQENDVFTREKIVSFIREESELTENQLFAALHSHQNDTLFEWAYENQKPAEAITHYLEEQQLNLRKKVYSGHAFYQVDETIELLLEKRNEYEQFELILLNEVGDCDTYSFPSEQDVFQKLKSLMAYPINALSERKVDLWNAKKERKHQQALIHDQVMRETYLEETGREM